MTCIAFDGKTLAADKRFTFACVSRTTTKIFRLPDGRLAAIAGDGASGFETIEWIKAGSDPEKFPACQRNRDSRATVTIFGKDGVWLYESEPTPAPIEDRFFADGSGRDYAMAAMHCGKTAREAVEIACLFDHGCGNGIDVLELE